jgi:hypothetical protein
MSPLTSFSRFFKTGHFTELLPSWPLPFHNRDKGLILVSEKLRCPRFSTRLPLDWMDRTPPERWRLDGKEVRYNWYSDDQ